MPFFLNDTSRQVRNRPSCVQRGPGPESRQVDEAGKGRGLPSGSPPRGLRLLPSCWHPGLCSGPQVLGTVTKPRSGGHPDMLTPVPASVHTHTYLYLHPYIYIHTPGHVHTNTPVPAHIHTLIHVHTHTCACTCAYTHLHTYTHLCLHMCMAHTYTCTCTPVHVHTPGHAHTNTTVLHTYTHLYMHTHTCDSHVHTHLYTYTHTYVSKTHVYMYMHSWACTHTCAPTNMCMYIHTCSCIRVWTLTTFPGGFLLGSGSTAPHIPGTSGPRAAPGLCPRLAWPASVVTSLFPCRLAV